MYNEQLQQQKQAKGNSSTSDEDQTDRQLNQGRTKIYQLAHDLERRMREFDERVARRRYILDVNLNFHTHCEEVCHSFLSSMSSVMQEISHVVLVCRLVDTSRSRLVDNRRRRRWWWEWNDCCQLWRNARSFKWTTRRFNGSVCNDWARRTNSSRLFNVSNWDLMENERWQTLWRAW